MRAFGGGEWGALNQIAHVEARGIGYPKSSRAERLKFQALSAATATHGGAEPFDTAYDKFAEYLRTSERRVVATGKIDWAEVFGKSWRGDLDRLMGYWVKHIGCRLATDGVPVHAALPDYLDGHGSLAHLRMKLEIRIDIAAAASHLEDVHGIEPSTLWIGPAEGEDSTRRGHVVRVWSHWGLGAVRLAYMYDFETADGADQLPHAGRATA